MVQIIAQPLLELFGISEGDKMLILDKRVRHFDLEGWREKQGVICQDLPKSSGVKSLPRTGYGYLTARKHFVIFLFRLIMR